MDGGDPEGTFSKTLDSKMELAAAHNGWFTEGNVNQALLGIVQMTDADKIQKWTSKYNLDQDRSQAKRIGIIMAGNIPMVGFHDLLCTLCAGHNAVVKLSSDDRVLLPFITDTLFEIEPSLKDSVEYVERLENFDAVIATGSNNSARYFEYYFKNKPNIIRKNRNSIAVLDGSETKEELTEFGKDLFLFYGLGCRNVSKVFLPKDFDLNRIFGAIMGYEDVADNKKYANNYEYYKAIYLMNSDDLLENGFFLMKEDTSLYSPVSMLFYERYDDIKEVNSFIENESENIQCIIGKNESLPARIDFGKSQLPELWDYADGVDTMDFLMRL